ncbi:putative beta-1,3-galactosyltransferase 20 [Symbiodinium microadriaticum]|uniref:Hexosyltransferase n=1 Tax=Symbiodinium microadriaticum TaxID=2951 RepID=A0A1Q9D7L5_SYMMI|nr:putative beta-1,3-galactosyltransferase 20 [Symbiodinium microadriaticum]
MRPISASTSVWVIITSRRDGFKRRAAARELWQDASCDQCKVIFQFVVCKEPQLSPSDAAQLDAEVKSFGDVQLLDCEEGYDKGRLVQKVSAGMRDFLSRSSSDYFMKVDDDAFVAWSRLCPRLHQISPKSHAYAGVPDIVNRTDWWFNNTESPNYDPWDNWPFPFYPFHMAGGPGYLIGSELLRAVAERFMRPPLSWNEDKAVGIAVHRANWSGLPVSYHYLHMDDGESDGLPFTGNWSDYPFLSQHQLSGKSIHCLHQVEKEGGRVDACYVHTPWLRELLRQKQDSH